MSRRGAETMLLLLVSGVLGSAVGLSVTWGSGPATAAAATCLGGSLAMLAAGGVMAWRSRIGRDRDPP